jgi:flavodoxin
MKVKVLVSILLLCLIIFTGCKIKGEDKKMISHKILVAYFSRAGEQYSVGNITEGNTAIVAKIIAQKTNGDLFEIKVKNDNYPKGYTALTEYAKKEMQQNARPEIVGNVENFEQYKTIFIGYPVWWGDKPMPVYTFLDSYDFKGKNIVPFCTHEGSGFCGTQGMEKTGAKVLKGLAIYGHTAQNDRTNAEIKITEWLKELDF